MTAEEDPRAAARRLNERDAAEQGITTPCDDPELLAAVAALMRPVLGRGGDAGE